MDRNNPRKWYYGLTDYGSYLKKKQKFTNTQSKHYLKQSKFEGSKRQLRGMIVKTLLEFGPLKIHSVKSKLREDKRIESVIGELIEEGMIVKKKAFYQVQ